MKKNIGSQLALYPMPVTVIGAMNGDKPTWTLVAHVGIIGHDRVLVSLAASHFINGIIKKNNKLSINIVGESILPEANYVGSTSGIKTDKSEVFDFTLGDTGTPVINKAPLCLECTVDDIYNTPDFESFICTIDNTYVEEEHLTE
ncbi:MAG: flavin reductase family protein, partial [Firmicutes bacterium]|nr:flavin reductase family protein [Bacillota bacterium]